MYVATAHNFHYENASAALNHNGGTEIVTSEEIALAHRENGFVYEVEEVITCLDRDKRESSIIPLQETRDIMALMDSIRYSWNMRYQGENTASRF